YDLERPEAECQQPEEAERDEPDHPDAEEEAGASMEVRRSDRNRAHAETPRDADAAPVAPRLRDEVAQRPRSPANSGTSRPRRRTTWWSLCPVETGAIAVRTAKDARFAEALPVDLSFDAYVAVGESPGSPRPPPLVPFADSRFAAYSTRA